MCTATLFLPERFLDKGFAGFWELSEGWDWIVAAGHGVPGNMNRVGRSEAAMEGKPADKQNE